MNRIPKLYAFAILALALVLVVSMPVAAKEIRGTLTSIVPDDLVFTMSDDAGLDHTFRLRADGKVMINQEPRTLAELQAGDNVTILYEVVDMDLVATLVQSVRE